MPVLIKGTGGGGMKVNGVKSKALAIGAVTKGNFLDNVPRILDSASYSTPNSVDQVLWLDANHYLVLMQPTWYDVWAYVREINQTTGVSTVSWTKQIGNFSTKIFLMAGGYVMTSRTKSGYTYLDLYSYSSGVLTLQSTITVSSTRTYYPVKVSDTEIFFYYFTDVWQKSMEYVVVTLNGSSMNKSAVKTVTIPHTTYSKPMSSIGLYFSNSPKAMVLFWLYWYEDKDGKSNHAYDQSGILSYSINASWDMTIVTNTRKTGSEAVLPPSNRFRNYWFRDVGGTNVTGGMKYATIYKSVLNSDCSVTENVSIENDFYIPNMLQNSIVVGDDIYILQASSRSFALLKCSWLDAVSKFEFKSFRKELDDYFRLAYNGGGTYGINDVKPALGGMVTVNGESYIAFECRLATPVDASSYYAYDKYGIMPIDTVYSVKNSDYSILPTTANGIKRIHMVALQDAVAGQKLDVLIADERDTAIFTI